MNEEDTTRRGLEEEDDDDSGMKIVPGELDVSADLLGDTDPETSDELFDEQDFFDEAPHPIVESTRHRVGLPTKILTGITLAVGGAALALTFGNSVEKWLMGKGYSGPFLCGRDCPPPETCPNPGECEAPPPPRQSVAPAAETAASTGSPPPAAEATSGQQGPQPSVLEAESQPDVDPRTENPNRIKGTQLELYATNENDKARVFAKGYDLKGHRRQNAPTGKWVDGKDHVEIIDPDGKIVIVCLAEDFNHLAHGGGDTQKCTKLDRNNVDVELLE